LQFVTLHELESQDARSITHRKQGIWCPQYKAV
jgi:hypothetical protein